MREERAKVIEERGKGEANGGGRGAAQPLGNSGWW